MPVTEHCNCSPEARKAVCTLPVLASQRVIRAVNSCPECGKTGKPVQKQTVNAMLSVTLRSAQDMNYLFCRTRKCPVVYFSADGDNIFTVDKVRERVYQKEPEADDVLVCYCFRHTVDDIKNSSAEVRLAVLENIGTGINAGQCACDLRNPQGSCCLGNVRRLIKQLQQSTHVQS